MKRFTAGLLHRSKSEDSSSGSNLHAPHTSHAQPHPDTPEAHVVKGIQLFCESGAANTDSGDEILQLPVIVEATESSPQAATSAAYQIRKFLSRENSNRPYVQYNAIMLVRILSDNPGQTFTRNLDGKFVNAVKELLKHGKDPSVQQILRETLDSLEADKSYDEGLTQLLTMWRNEKGRGSRITPNVGKPPNFHVPPYNPNQPPVPPSQQESSQRVFGRNQLPPPHELVSRVEEAKNTAKILLQFLQSTPPEEVLGNDLIKEFSERCQTAQRSIQEYINCDSPPPDDDTLQTLIEVNEQLSLALSRHQRAILSARRAMGASSVSPNPAQNSAYPPPGPQYQQQNQEPTSLFSPSQLDPQAGVNSTTSGTSPVSPVSTFDPPPGPPPSHLAQGDTQTANPFADPGQTYTPYSIPQQPEHDNSLLHPQKPLSAVPGHMDRPAAGGAYYHGATPSYLGRQLSAADGLTMHGGVEDEVDASNSNQHAGQSGSHGRQGNVSHVETRAPVTYRY